MSTWYGETRQNLFWVQQWVTSGKQSTRTCLLVATQLTTWIFLDSHPQLTHNILKNTYSYYKIQHITWWNANDSNSWKSHTGCHEILKSWIYVTRFAKTWHNGACWNFQYKAFIKLCAKMHFIKNLWKLVVVTSIYKNLVPSDSLSCERLKYFGIVFVL